MSAFYALRYTNHAWTVMVRYNQYKSKGETLRAILNKINRLQCFEEKVKSLTR